MLPKKATQENPSCLASQGILFFLFFSMFQFSNLNSLAVVVQELCYKKFTIIIWNAWMIIYFEGKGLCQFNSQLLPLSSLSVFFSSIFFQLSDCTQKYLSVCWTIIFGTHCVFYYVSWNIVAHASIDNCQ